MDDAIRRELSTAADMAGLQMEFLELLRDAERYRWLRDNPLWSVGYRIKPRSGMKEWRMLDEGDYWGSWWPTHEQAVDHAMALDQAIAASRASLAVGAA